MGKKELRAELLGMRRDGEGNFAAGRKRGSAGGRRTRVGGDRQGMGKTAIEREDPTFVVLLSSPRMLLSPWL